jgi:hypothetical protein
MPGSPARSAGLRSNAFGRSCALQDSRIHRARNDYLHGNKVSDVQLTVAPYGRFLPDYAPVLYRAALLGLLSPKFDEPKPAESNRAEYDAWFSRDFSHRRFNREMESALGTFELTREQQKRKRLGQDWNLRPSA